MRVIYEENIERMDFLELIVTQEEYDYLSGKGIVADFKEGLTSKRPLNVFLRIEGQKAEGE